jgi:hypothetical protein
VAAWDRIEPGLDLLRAFRAQFRGERVTLTEGGQANVELRAVPAEEIEREAAKIP